MSEQSVADSFADQLKTFFYATVGKVAELQPSRVGTSCPREKRPGELKGNGGQRFAFAHPTDTARGKRMIGEGE